MSNTIEPGDEVTVCACVSDERKRPAKISFTGPRPLLLCAECAAQYMDASKPMPELFNTIAVQRRAPISN